MTVLTATTLAKARRWGAFCCSRLRRLRSEEHTSELQSQSNLVCRLLLEKKKKLNMLFLSMRVKDRTLQPSPSEVTVELEEHPHTENHCENANLIGITYFYGTGQRSGVTL